MEHLSNRDDRDSSLPEPYHPPMGQPNPYQTEKIVKSGGYSDQEAANDRLHRSQDDKDRHRLPFGWTPIVFGMVIALITAVIVGGSVGGGVGGALSKKHCSSASKTTSVSTLPSSMSVQSPNSASQSTRKPSPSADPTTVSSAASTGVTNYAPLPSNNILSLNLDCPSIDGQIYTSSRGQQYKLRCGLNYAGGDIASLFAYDWRTCVESCTSVNHYNESSPDGNLSCQHILFRSAITTDSLTYDRTCWLKTKDSFTVDSDLPDQLLVADLVIS